MDKNYEMEDRLAKVIYDSKKIDKKFLEDIINIVADFRKINFYYDEFLIKFMDVNYPSTVACFDGRNSTINLYILGSFMEYINNKIHANIKFNDKNEALFYYKTFFLMCLLHELEHVYQCKVIESNREDVEAKIIKSSNIIYIWKPLSDSDVHSDIRKQGQRLVDQYYIFSPDERMAYINSIKTVKNVLSLLDCSYESINDYYDKRFTHSCYDAYARSDMICCPTVTFLLGMGWTHEEISRVFDWYNAEDLDRTLATVSMKYNLSKRIYYGFPK